MFSATSARIANYVCAALSLIILLARLIISRWSNKPANATFYLVICSVAVVVTRVVVNHYYLKFGTASDALSDAHYFNAHDEANIKAGTILSLVSRILIALLCWLQISILLLWYSELIYGILWVRRMIKLCWTFAGLTFVAVVLSTFLECQPFHRYWQLEPNPGRCVKAYVQILIQGLSNIILDLMLLVIAFPLIAVSNRTWIEHLRVGSLFVLGTFCIIVTILRFAAIFQQNSAQPTRSLWASIQMLVSIFVANTPSIYGIVKLKKRKKSEQLIRRASRAEDLMRSTTESTPPMPSLSTYDKSTDSEIQQVTSSSKVWSQHCEDTV